MSMDDKCIVLWNEYGRIDGGTPETRRDLRRLTCMMKSPRTKVSNPAEHNVGSIESDIVHGKRDLIFPSEILFL